MLLLPINAKIWTFVIPQLILTIHVVKKKSSKFNTHVIYFLFKVFITNFSFIMNRWGVANSKNM